MDDEAPKETSDQFRLSRLRLRGFRRLADVDLELRPLMVLIGPNAVGKSSLLDAWALIAAAADGKLAERLSAMGGITSVATAGSDLTLGWEVEWRLGRQDLSLRHRVSLRPHRVGYRIAEEALQACSADGVLAAVAGADGAWRTAPNPDTEPPTNASTETALSQVPIDDKTYEPLSRVLPRVGGTALKAPRHAMRAALRPMKAFGRLGQVSTGPTSPMRLPQAVQPATAPGANGETLIPLLYSLRESGSARYDLLMEVLSLAFPRFERLGFPSVATGMLALQWKEKAVEAPFYANQLSDGTLRFLLLVSLLEAADLPAVTLIEEPETGLHPALLRLLVESLRSASRRSTVIVATHSEALARFLEPSELVVMDMLDDGTTRATWADTLDLDQWLADFSLDELWRMSILEGRALEERA